MTCTIVIWCDTILAPPGAEGGLECHEYYSSLEPEVYAAYEQAAIAGWAFKGALSFCPKHAYLGES